MRKSILSLLMCASLCTAKAEVVINPSTHDKNVETLTNDRDFVAMQNSIFTFVSNVSKANAATQLRKYESGQANSQDIAKLNDATGYKNEEELKTFYSALTNHSKVLRNRYSFLSEKTSGSKVINDATISLVQKNKITSIKRVGEDCLGYAALYIASCGAAELICESQWGWSEFACNVWILECFIAAWAFLDSCYINP